jgi:hypothetical protein
MVLARQATDKTLLQTIKEYTSDIMNGSIIEGSRLFRIFSSIADRSLQF